MRRSVVLCACVIALGCGKKEQKPSSGGETESAAEKKKTKSAKTDDDTDDDDKPSDKKSKKSKKSDDGDNGDKPAAKGKESPERENLFSAAAGAMILEEPSEKNNYDPWGLIDDHKKSYWMMNAKGAHKLVLTLPQTTTVKELFWQGGAKKVTVEASADGKDFEKIASATLVESDKNHSMGDGSLQEVPVTKQVKARVFRITAENTGENVANNGIVAYGEKNDEPKLAAGNITGQYAPMEESLGEFNVKQEGTAVTGCVANGTIEFSGAVEGGLVRGRWWNRDSKTGGGPMAINITADGSKVAYLFWNEGSNASMEGRTAPLKSKTPGTCPSWKAKAVDPIEAELEKFGRARIYGILFDTDSDVLKPESMAVIDRVAKVLKAKPEWKMTVEGHTDNTATASYNQGLSEKRAKAVKKALEAKGIDASRLMPVGKGQGSPVASNDTSAGRAQNRRVELAKE